MGNTLYCITITVNGTEFDLEALEYLILKTIKGTGLKVSGDSSHADISYTTKEPWKLLEFCASVGEMDNISILNTSR